MVVTSGTAGKQLTLTAAAIDFSSLVSLIEMLFLQVSQFHKRVLHCRVIVRVDAEEQERICILVI